MDGNILNREKTTIGTSKLGLIFEAVKELFKDLGGNPIKLPLPCSAAGRELVAKIVSLLLHGSSDERKFIVKVHRCKSIERLADDNGFSINPMFRGQVTSVQFPLPSEIEIAGEIEKTIEVELMPLKSEMSCFEILAHLEKEKYRPLDWQELLELGGQHEDLQREFPMAALGTIISVGSQKYILFIFENRGRRNINLALCSSGKLPQRLRIPVVKIK